MVARNLTVREEEAPAGFADSLGSRLALGCVSIRIGNNFAATFLYERQIKKKF